MKKMSAPDYSKLTPEERKQKTAALEDKFRTASLKLMDANISMIQDVNEEGYTETKPGILSVARKMLENYADVGGLIKAFIDKKVHWESIREKRPSFLSSDMDQVFAGLPAGANAVLIPIKLYEDYKSGKIKTKKVFPIEERDIESLWVSLNFLIDASIMYNDITQLGYDLNKYRKKK